MIYLGLDFETKDPMLKTYGAGWAFAYNLPENSITYPIGYSICMYDDTDETLSTPEYFELTTKSLDQAKTSQNCLRLRDLLKKYPNVVCHHAQYDIGWLLALGIPLDNLIVHDTLVAGKLYDSALNGYSLSYLLKKYKQGEKIAGSLGDVVAKYDLLKTPKGNSPNKETKTYVKRAKDYAYANMDLIQELEPDVMARYANHDTFGMMKLFKFYSKRLDLSLVRFYSNIQKICVKIRSRGIKVSMEAIERAEEALSPALKETQDYLYAKLGQLNLRSSQQVAEKLEELGYTVPYTEAGNPSANKEFIEEHPNDELCQAIARERTLYKLLNDFVIKTKETQRYSCPEVMAGSKYGRLFPEMNLLEARTGRFSSSNPNIQNIPKRHELAHLCRDMFVCDDDLNNWYSLDWSNQEGRLQLHYSVLKGFRKANWWLKQFEENPKLDTHSLVAEMMGGVDRNIAKTIYLGKSFCMGGAKLCKRLGLPTAVIDYGYGPMEGAGEEGDRLIKAYDKAFPYLKELQKDCTEVIKDKGYIKTIGGRSCKRPPRHGRRDLDYKAISLLIQGSAADQMYIALTEADKAGINIKCIVHDEFNIEGQDKDAKLMQEIMQTCVPMKVPSIAEIKVGKSWGSLKELEENNKCK